MKKEIRPVVAFALKNGFERVYSQSGHIMLKKNGRRISISCSPSQPTIAAKKAMRDVQHVLDLENV